MKQKEQQMFLSIAQKLLRAESVLSDEYRTHRIIMKKKKRENGRRSKKVKGASSTAHGSVKRSKRNPENKFISKNDQNGINSTLSAEQIAKRSKELKDGLARTAALAENEIYKKKIIWN